MDESEVCAVILDRVNTVRTTLGHGVLTELPVGTRRDPDGCVIANALKDVVPDISVSTTHISVGPNAGFEAIIRQNFYGGGHGMDLTTKAFISWFDEGHLPALVDPSRPEYVGAPA